MPPKKQNVASRTSNPERKYEAFVQGLEVVGIALSSSECKIDRTAYFKAKERIKYFKHEYGIAHLEDGSFEGRAHFLVTVSTAKDDEPAVSIKCSFVAHIHGTAPILEAHAARFADSELRLILVPFARQYIATVSGLMAIAPVIIPLTSRIGTKRGVRTPPTKKMIEG